MQIFPLTPGLLVSMAIRNNHAFGAPSNDFFPDPLATRQIKDLREVALLYPKLVRLLAYESFGMDPYAGLKEEITGKGFYKPELEQNYRGWACDEALLEAIQLAGDKVSYDGPKPTVVMLDEINPETGQEFSPDDIDKKVFFD